MIRTTIALFVLAVVICGLIVFRPFSGGDNVATDRSTAPIETGVVVTRAAVTPGSNSFALAAAAAAVNPSVTAPTTEPDTAPLRVDVIHPNTDVVDLTAMTNSVLAQLGFEGVQPAPIDAQRQSTSDILAGIEAATGHRSVPVERETLETILVAALRARETDQSIDAIVNAAASAGTVAVPEILVTSDGRVDTSVILRNIITQAHIATGGAAPAIPIVTPDDTVGMEIRLDRRANQDVQVRYYTVQSGDSLGSISIIFYGAVAGYDNIFAANTALLSSPDFIRAGQQLLIP